MKIYNYKPNNKYYFIPSRLLYLTLILLCTSLFISLSAFSTISQDNTLISKEYNLHTVSTISPQNHLPKYISTDKALPKAKLPGLFIIFSFVMCLNFAFFSYNSIKGKKKYLENTSKNPLSPESLKIESESDLEVAKIHKELLDVNNENKFLKTTILEITKELNSIVYIVSKDYDLISNPKGNNNRAKNNTKCYEYFHNLDSPCNWCQISKITEENTTTPLYNTANINNEHYKYKFIPTEYRMNNDAFMVIANNISEEKILSEERKEKDELLNNLYNDTLSGIVVINNENKIVLWNKISEKLFGYKFKEIENCFFSLIVKLNKKQSLIFNNINNILNKGESSLIGEVIETEIINRKNIVLPVEMSISPYYKDGIWHAIIIVKDVSKKKFIEAISKTEKIFLKNKIKKKTKELDSTINKLKLANKKLIEANKLKSKFLICLSHELKTPLNGIIGFCDLLSKQYYGKTNQKQDEYLSLINRNGNHLLYLINNLLDFSKVEKHKIDFIKENTKVKSLILDILKVLEYDLLKKSLKISYFIDEELPDIFVDRVRFKQVFLNLVSNSIKFSKPRSKIIIKAEKQNQQIKISVTDFGIGIKEEHKEKIFMEFFQADSVRDKALGGTGIGLALAKKLVELQGGSIGVESAESQGSTFWFTLPIHAS